MSIPHRYLIVVAGGKGVRMGSAIPKQFLLLAGRPLIFHTIGRFIDYDPGMEIIIVLPSGSESLWKELCSKYNFTQAHHIVSGGSERFNSVKNGLSLVRQESLVAVHDAVRPLVSQGTIDRCFTMAARKGNAVPFTRPSESVRETLSSKASRPISRDTIALVQTPQVFRSDILLAAFAQPYSPSFTDDASVVEAAGNRINLVEGNRENIKITTGEDLLVAESFFDHMGGEREEADHP